MFVVPKHALTNGAEPRLGWRPGLLGAFVACEQGFEVKALEFLATVYHEDLGKTAMTSHALSQNHHAGAVAGWIKGKHDRQQTTRESVGQQGQPGTAKVTTRLRADKLDIKFGVIDVADVIGTVPMARCSEFSSKYGGSRPYAALRPFLFNVCS